MNPSDFNWTAQWDLRSFRVKEALVVLEWFAIPNCQVERENKKNNGTRV